MIFRKTILTFIVYGFLFCAKSQHTSPETVSDTAFQQNSFFLKKLFSSPTKKKTSDSILHSLRGLVDRVEKNENKYADKFFKRTNSKHLETLQKNKKNETDTFFKSTNSKHLETLQKNIKNETDKFFKQPVGLKKAQLEYTGLADSSYWLPGYNYYVGNFIMSSEWLVAGIPVSANLYNQHLADETGYSTANFDFRFDKDAYLEQIKKKLAGKLNPSAVINNIEDPLKIIKEKAEQLLKKDLSVLAMNYDGLLDQDIAAINSTVGSLFSNDIKELRQRFLKYEIIQKAFMDEVRLSALKQKTNLGEKVSEEDINHYKASVRKLKGLEEMLLKIQEHKSQWERSGLLKKINEFEVFKKFKAAQLINDPSFIRKKAKEYLSLKGIQRFFLNVNRLNIGRDALSLSPLSFRHFLQNGISTEFLNSKGNTLMLVAGKQKDINSVLDEGFTSSLVSGNNKVAAGRIGLISSGISNTHLSVSYFNQSMSDHMGMPDANELRRILVTTISNQLSIGRKGSIEIDLSRSATAYRDNNVSGDSLLKPMNNLTRIFSSENLMSNTALSVRYADEYTEKGLAYQFNFSKVANGYINPGSSFLNSGALEVGGRIRKLFLKNRIQLSFRGNVRDYKYNDELDSRWRNTFIVADGKWKMKKGQYIGIRYQPNRMARIENGTKSIATSMDRLSIESNLYRKIGKTGYRNYLTLARQKNSYALSATENISNTSLQLNTFQNFSFRKNLLYANLSYSRAVNASAYVYFNTSLNTDIGYTFQLFKKITSSSGIVYASVNEWYRQIGIRQALGGQLNERFYINIYVDARKNLQLLQPLWNSPVRADISIKYIIKK